MIKTISELYKEFRNAIDNFLIKITMPDYSLTRSLHFNYFILSFFTLVLSRTLSLFFSGIGDLFVIIDLMFIIYIDTIHSALSLYGNIGREWFKEFAITRNAYFRQNLEKLTQKYPKQLQYTKLWSILDKNCITSIMNAPTDSLIKLQ